MYDDREDFWVVLCRNHRFHDKGNTSYSHQTVLAETDAFSPLPMLTQQVTVRGDACGAEYSYKATEKMRGEMETAPAFVPHPMFK